MKDDLLLVRLLVENDAGAADFRTRACGGRDRDDRRDAGGVRASPPVADVSKSHNGRVCPDMNATTLPASSADPPPNATTPSWPPAR